ncbi:alpha/beta fold hydrolase [Pseudomonas frederiksbergensis]
MKRTLVFAAVAAGLLQLIGCASQISLQQFTSPSLAPATLKTTQYTLQAMIPPPGTYRHLRVYIEGDGHAWATSSQPSTDPTPRTSLMLKYASEDRTPAAYLARPCQFVMTSSCNVGAWTDRRFARPVMEAMNASLDSLKSRFGVDEFELVGHSGGGDVALVLAGMRRDVVQVQTIAGNVDPVFWTQLHKLSPLSDPITPRQYLDRLRNLPQRHIVGTDDAVVPPAIAQEYAKQLGATCLEIASTTATHSTGFDDAWHHYSNTPIACKSQ